jgi:Reverse transcriptase (RNA-dependent DNA polymerase)
LKTTSDTLNYISNIIYNKLDKSKPIIIAFIDLAKAFDTVDHHILFEKLNFIGIRGKALDLIVNYLSDRQQSVKIGEINSSYKQILMGVPQGTILGPLLFILYIYDLLCRMPDDQILSYADDTALIASAESWEETESQINFMLSVISNWMALNKLSLNYEKTVFMCFGNYIDSVPQKIYVKIKNKILKRVEQYKYLGIIFDFNMKWDSHVQYIISKTKYLTYVFYHLVKSLSIETLLLIYYAFFNSIATYGIIAWGGCLFKYNKISAITSK